MSGGRLVVLDRSGRPSKSFPLPSGSVSLGRGPACDIRVLQPVVASHHATVAVHANQTLIHNVSDGETLVNGFPVSVAALRHNDVITIGDRSLRWEYDDPTIERPLMPEQALYNAGGRPARAPRRATAGERLQLHPAQRASMPGSAGGKQVAIVQPQRRDTSEQIESPPPPGPRPPRPRAPRAPGSPLAVDSFRSARPPRLSSKNLSLHATTKATLWIESRKSSPRPGGVGGGGGRTPLRLAVLKRAHSAHRQRVTKIQAPAKIDHMKQAALMLMTGHTPKSTLSPRSPGVSRTPRVGNKTPKSPRGNSARRNDRASVLDISESTRDETPSRSTPLPTPLLPSPKKSALKDPHKKPSRKNESIKFDLSNLENYSQEDDDVLIVSNTTRQTRTNDSKYDSLTDDNLTLQYSDSSVQSGLSPSPRRSIHSRSSRMLEHVGSPLKERQSHHSTLTPESPSARKSLRGSRMVESALETPDANSTRNSKRSKTLDQSWDATAESAFKTRTLSPRKLESYSIVDLVSVDSNDSTQSASVYDSVGSTRSSSIVFGTPQSGRKTRSTIGSNMLCSSTPYVKGRPSRRSQSNPNISKTSPGKKATSRRSKSLTTPENSEETQKHISLDSTRISRHNRSRSRINDSDLLLVAEAAGDDSPKTSRRSAAADKSKKSITPRKVSPQKSPIQASPRQSPKSGQASPNKSTAIQIISSPRTSVASLKSPNLSRASEKSVRTSRASLKSPEISAASPKSPRTSLNNTSFSQASDRSQRTSARSLNSSQESSTSPSIIQTNVRSSRSSAANLNSPRKSVQSPRTSLKSPEASQASEKSLRTSRASLNSPRLSSSILKSPRMRPSSQNTTRASMASVKSSRTTLGSLTSPNTSQASSKRQRTSQVSVKSLDSSQESITSPDTSQASFKRQSTSRTSVRSLNSSQESMTSPSPRQASLRSPRTNITSSKSPRTSHSSPKSPNLSQSPRRSSPQKSPRGKRNTKSNLTLNTELSYTGDEGTVTPENVCTPEEAGTPVLSIQSLLDSSHSSLVQSPNRTRQSLKRKTIGSINLSYKSRQSLKGKSFTASVRKSLRSLQLSKENNDVEENVTPKSAVKLVQEAVKNKHSTAKKPLSKRSIIDNLNESDIVKQLFNSPVKRKLSQSMTEFSRKKLFDEEEEVTRFPKRNTIALTGRSPDNSFLERTDRYTPENFVSPLSSPENTPLTGVKRLYAKNTPENDLRSVRGVKTLLKTPRTRKSVRNDLTNVSGVKAVFAKSPRNRLSDVRVKEVFAASPNNDLRRVSGVKTLFRSQKKRKSPRNDLSDVQGVRSLFTRKSPANDLRNVSGVKKIMRVNTPRNDLSDVRGIKRMFGQEKGNDNYHDVSGVEELFNESNISTTSKKSEVLFDQLIGKPPIKAVYSKSLIESRRIKKKPKRITKSLRRSIEMNNVEEWIEQELKKSLHKAAKTNGNRELQKLATDTVEGSDPLRTSRIRNTTIQDTTQKSVSQVYSARKLPIKKRSFVEASLEKTVNTTGNQSGRLPIKKRLVVHSTPVKGRYNLTMNASELGRVSPIQALEATHLSEAANRSKLQAKQSPKQKAQIKTLTKQSTMILEITPQSSPRAKGARASKQADKKTDSIPSPKATRTRGKQKEETTATRAKKVSNITKSPPKLKGRRTKANVTTEKPDSPAKDKPEPKTRRTRNTEKQEESKSPVAKQGRGRKGNNVTEKTKPSPAKPTRSLRNKTVAEVTNTKKRRSSLVITKKAPAANVKSKAKEASIVEHSPKKTATRKQKAVVKPISPKVTRISLVVSKPSPKLKPRAKGAQNKKPPTPKQSPIKLRGNKRRREADITVIEQPVESKRVRKATGKSEEEKSGKKTQPSPTRRGRKPVDNNEDIEPPSKKSRNSRKDAPKPSPKLVSPKRPTRGRRNPEIAVEEAKTKRGRNQTKDVIEVPRTTRKNKSEAAVVIEEPKSRKRKMAEEPPAVPAKVTKTEIRNTRGKKTESKQEEKSPAKKTVTKKTTSVTANKSVKDVKLSVKKSNVTIKSPAKKTTRNSGNKSTKSPTKEAKKSTTQSPTKVTKKSSVKVAKKSPVKVTKKSPVKVTKKSPVKATKKSPAKKTPVKVAKKSPVKVAKKAPVKKSPAKKAEPKAKKQEVVESSRNGRRGNAQQDNKAENNKTRGAKMAAHSSVTAIRSKRSNKATASPAKAVTATRSRRR